MTTMQLSYGKTRELDLDFSATVARAKELLAQQGFGVLSEIDVAATLRAKLGADIGQYVILGACKPDAAKHALDADPDVGLLLPCNVIVRRSAGRTTVGVVNASAMLQLTGDVDLAATAADVDARLDAVLDGMAGSAP